MSEDEQSGTMSFIQGLKQESNYEKNCHFFCTIINSFEDGGIPQILQASEYKSTKISKTWQYVREKKKKEVIYDEVIGLVHNRLIYQSLERQSNTAYIILNNQYSADQTSINKSTEL